MVYGTADLINTKMLMYEDFIENEDKHCIPIVENMPKPYKKTYAWIFTNAVRFKEPVKYKHPQGAVIWVNLDNCILNNKNNIRRN
jgi:hypothetical protein